MKLRLLLLFLALAPLALNAQFTTDTIQNTLVHNVQGSDQVTPLSATTSGGKTYISWFDNSSGSYVLRMQLLNVDGTAAWAPNGIIVSAYPQNTALFRYDLVTDQEDNAIVAFQDERSGSLKVVAYKVTPSGVLAWGAAGVQLTDSVADGLAPRITVTQTNHVIVAWNSTIGSAKWISFQKISPAGNIVWSKRIFDTSKYSRAVMVPTGTDDFLMMYVKETGNFPGVTSTMFAQRFDTNGLPVWTLPVQVSTKTIAFFFFPELIRDGQGGFYTAFNTSNPVVPSLIDVYAQRVSNAGTLWSATGTQLSNSSTENKSFGGACISNTNTLRVALQVLDGGQSNAGISFQALDSAGAVLLGATGQALKPVVSPIYHRPLALANSGNSYILVFTESTGFGTDKIKALKVDDIGTNQWSYDPTICANPSGKDDLTAGKYTAGQLVLVWADDRLTIGSDNGVYAQNIQGNGSFGAVSTGLPAISTVSSPVLYPNPGRSVSLLLPEGSASGLLRVVDITGREIYRSVHTGGNLISIPTIETEGLYSVEWNSNGAYYRLKWMNR